MTQSTDAPDIMRKWQVLSWDYVAKELGDMRPDRWDDIPGMPLFVIILSEKE